MPRGTRVLGVDLGGMSRTEAEQALTDAVGPRTGDPVAVDLAGERFPIEAADIALRLAIDAERRRRRSRAARGWPASARCRR